MKQYIKLEVLQSIKFAHSRYMIHMEENEKAMQANEDR